MTVEAAPRTEAECQALIKSLGSLVNDFLSTVIPDDGKTPRTLLSAMKYSLNAGGKRLRPVLTLATYHALGGNPADVLRPACALELIHTYSLIHDDLPCMDDDDLRRGQPTLHKQYSEAIAVLAGDALHALAFELLASAGNPAVVLEVSRAIGISGMLGGQVADVEAEGRDITLDQIEYIHRNKTGALIRVAMRIGAIMAGADDETIAVFSSYGSKIGLVFQIVDDVLDVTGSQEKLGKDIGSDERNVKATYPRVIGLEESRRLASELIESGKREIGKIGPNSAVFKYLADFIVKREN
jgi:geranylgeranyl diphosphate synthase type II